MALFERSTHAPEQSVSAPHPAPLPPLEEDDVVLVTDAVATWAVDEDAVVVTAVVLAVDRSRSSRSMSEQPANNESVARGHHESTLVY